MLQFMSYLDFLRVKITVLVTTASLLEWVMPALYHIDIAKRKDSNCTL